MASGHPTTDQRRVSALRAELERVGSAVVPGWQGAVEPGEFGRALVEIAARLAEETTRRLDQTAERDALAFFDVLDIPPAAPQAALATVVFSLDESRTAPLSARARVQLGAEVEGREVIYETLTALELSPARVIDVVAVDPRADRIERAPARVHSVEKPAASVGGYEVVTFAETGATTLQVTPSIGLEPDDLVRIGSEVYQIAAVDQDLLALEAPLAVAAAAGTPFVKVDALESFDLRNRQRHVFYVGHEQLFNLEQPSQIGLTLAPEGLVRRLGALNLEYRMWGTKAGEEAPAWHVLNRLGSAESRTDLLKAWSGTVDSFEVDGNENRWLRVELLDPIAEGVAVNTKASRVGITVKSDQNSPVKHAFHNGSPLAIAGRFYPFGSEPTRFDIFFLAAPEALSKTGAKVTIELDKADSSFVALEQSAIVGVAADEHETYGIGMNGHLHWVTTAVGKAVASIALDHPKNDEEEEVLFDVKAGILLVSKLSGTIGQLVVARDQAGQLRSAEFRQGDRPAVWHSVGTDGNGDRNSIALISHSHHGSATLLRINGAAIEARTLSYAGEPLTEWRALWTTSSVRPVLDHSTGSKPVAIAEITRPGWDRRLSYHEDWVLSDANGHVWYGRISNDTSVDWTRLFGGSTGFRPAATQFVDGIAGEERLSVAFAHDDGGVAQWLGSADGATIDGPRRPTDQSDFQLAVGSRIRATPQTWDLSAPQPLVTVVGSTDDGLALLTWAAGDRVIISPLQGDPVTPDQIPGEVVTPGHVVHQSIDSGPAIVVPMSGETIALASTIPIVRKLAFSLHDSLVIEGNGPKPDDVELSSDEELIDVEAARVEPIDQPRIERNTTSVYEIGAIRDGDVAYRFLKRLHDAEFGWSVTAADDAVAAAAAAADAAVAVGEAEADAVIAAEAVANTEAAAALADAASAADPTDVAAADAAVAAAVALVDAKAVAALADSAEVDAKAVAALADSAVVDADAAAANASSSSGTSTPMMITLDQADTVTRVNHRLIIGEKSYGISNITEDSGVRKAELDGSPAASVAGYVPAEVLEEGPITDKDRGTLLRVTGLNTDELGTLEFAGDPPFAYTVDEDTLRNSNWIRLTDAWTTMPTALMADFYDGQFTIEWRTESLAAEYNNPELSWEFFDGDGWRTIESEFADSTNHLATTGAISFRVPHELAPTEIGGREDYWLRARLVGGDYGRPRYVVTTDPNDPNAQITRVDTSEMNPPEITSLSVSYELHDVVTPESVLVTNNLGTLDQTQASSVDQARFDLFRGAIDIDESTPERAIYVGLTREPAVSPLVLYAVVDDQVGEGKLRVDALTAAGWRRCTVDDETESLRRRGLVQVSLNESLIRENLFGTEGYWLRLRPMQSHADDWAPTLRGLFVNAVRANHARTIEQELLGSSLGEPSMAVTLTDRPVLPDTLELRVREELSEEERGALEDERRERLRASGRLAADRPPIVEQVDIADGSWVLWRRVDSFVGADGDARIYRLDPKSGEITFGNGRQGKIPPAGRDAIRAFEYQQGGGADGNAPAWTELATQSELEGVDTVVLPVEATGGVDGPGRAALMASAPARLRHGGQALTTADLEALAVAFSPEIARATCIRPTGPNDPIRVVIAQRDGTRCPVPSLAQRAAIARSLRSDGWGGLSPQSISVDPPTYVRLALTVNLQTPARLAAQVEQQATATLIDFLHPVDGGPDGDGWEFGRRLWESDVLRVLSRVDNIDRIDGIEIVRIDGGSLDSLPNDVLICTEESAIDVQVEPVVER